VESCPICDGDCETSPLDRDNRLDVRCSRFGNLDISRSAIRLIQREPSEMRRVKKNLNEVQRFNKKPRITVEPGVGLVFNFQ